MLPTIPSCSVDVVIVGGGIQGLWLLTDLIDAGRVAVLLEKSGLGADQSSHSHGFIHQGHMYATSTGTIQDAIDAAGRLKDAHDKWTEAFRPGQKLASLIPLSAPFYLAWKNEKRSLRSKDICRDASLDLTEVDTLPDGMGSFSYAQCVQEAFCIDPLKVFQTLQAHKSSGAYTSLCDSIQWSNPNTTPIRLRADRGPRSIDIECRAVVLAAGTGNQDILNEFSKSGLDIQARQQTIATYMLVLRHKTRTFRPVSGLFPENRNLFIAPRPTPDGTVFLVGDAQRRHIEGRSFKTLKPGEWFDALLPGLNAIIPETKRPEDFLWSHYPATKAEPHTSHPNAPDGGAFPREPFFKRQPQSNIWVTWPTLFTFAPLASDAVREELCQDPSDTKQDLSAWEQFREQPTLPPKERWEQNLPLLDWSEFQVSIRGE